MVVEFAVLKSGTFFTLQQSMLAAFTEIMTAGESSWSTTSLEAMELLHQEKGTAVRWIQYGLALRFSSSATQSFYGQPNYSDSLEEEEKLLLKLVTSQICKILFKKEILFH